MLRRLGYRTKGHLQHCTSFRRSFHGSSTGSSTELSSSTSSSSTVVHESLPVGLPSHLVEQLTTHSSDGRAGECNRRYHAWRYPSTERWHEDRVSSRRSRSDTGSARQCRGRQRASWPPRGLQRATAEEHLFCQKAQKTSEAIYRELLGRLVSVSGARCDKVVLAHSLRQHLNAGGVGTRQHP